MKIRRILWFASIAAASLRGGDARAQTDVTAPHAYKLEGDIEGVHDPSIIKEGDTWYLFGTVTEKVPDGQLPIRCSKDLHLWKRCGYVFPGVPDWIKKVSPETKDLWAPDPSYFNGVYHIYYAYSAFGKNTSGIALVTNKTLDPSSPDFKWMDQGVILVSKVEDDFNAIDPNIAFDTDGRAWLSFGSFWSGIKMREIDPATGKLLTSDTKLYSLATRKRPANPPANPPGLPGNWQAVEAPVVVHHGDYYYLFVSFDLCCRGVKSTYRTMVGRAKIITGPYVDASGTAMLKGGGTQLLGGNSRWIGPGGESVLQQRQGDIIVFHAYDGKTGTPSLQISSLTWKNGWPHAVLDDGAGTAGN
jgi:arabinan endo-1,5-alpha-L-arabinosidase